VSTSQTQKAYFEGEQLQTSTVQSKGRISMVKIYWEATPLFLGALCSGNCEVVNFQIFASQWFWISTYRQFEQGLGGGVGITSNDVGFDAVPLW
jgi:hypothetical protein